VTGVSVKRLKRFFIDMRWVYPQVAGVGRPCRRKRGTAPGRQVRDVDLLKQGLKLSRRAPHNHEEGMHIDDDETSLNPRKKFTEYIAAVIKTPKK